MAAQSFIVNIQGYWRDANKTSVPNHSGVYFVYEGTHNRTNGTVTLHRLLYVGEAENVNLRIQKHEKYSEWCRHVSVGRELYFSTGLVPGEDRFRVEAGYVFEHKPPLNTEFRDSFPFDQITIRSTGRTALLYTNFTVYRA